MKWIPLELTIDAPVLEVYDLICSIQPNAIISGGYLCDLHMGTPFKDVDIFIRQNNKKQRLLLKKIETLISKAVIEDRNEDYDKNFGFDIHSFTFKDFSFQLIFGVKGITSVKSFDFRFREFFYLKGQAYASESALKDIKAKKLAIANFQNTMRTFQRGLKFEKRYDFSFDTLTNDLFISYFSSGKFFPLDAKKHKLKHYDYETLVLMDHTEVRNRAEELSVYTTNFPHEAIAYYRNFHRSKPIDRNWTEQFLSQTFLDKLSNQVKQYVFKTNPFNGVFQKSLTDMMLYFNCYRLSLLTALPTEVFVSLQQFTEQFAGESYEFYESYEFFPVTIDTRNHASQFVREFHGLLVKLTDDHMEWKKLQSEITYSISNQYWLFEDRLTPRRVLKADWFLIRMPLGSFIYDSTAKQCFSPRLFCGSKESSKLVLAEFTEHLSKAGMN
jgi:hypothetical protein